MNSYLKSLDKDYLRLPTKNKVPLRKDWSLPVNSYYKEPLTIPQLLAQYGEYGIRLGLLVKKDYHLAALYFRSGEIVHYAKLFPTISYTQTENGLYYFLLIKELPPNSLLKTLQGEIIGNCYSSGKLVIGAQSLINNYLYQLIKSSQDYLTFNFLSELLSKLSELNLYLEIHGSVKFNPQPKEWFFPSKLKARWKRINQAKLIKCLDCSRALKPINLINHLTKIHHRKSRSKKLLRVCSQCHRRYSTLIKRREHKEFYCKENQPKNWISEIICTQEDIGEPNYPKSKSL